MPFREFWNAAEGVPYRVPPRIANGYLAPRNVLFRTVKLLLDDCGTRRLVDASLDRRAAVVALVDRSCQFDEPRAEIPLGLAGTNLILDLPKRFVHGLQFANQGVQCLRAGNGLPLDGQERPQFALNVPPRSVVADLRRIPDT